MNAEFAQSRLYFPRGLFQPENSFRFSIDALLLGAFVKTKNNARLLDLGTGCGVVGLSILLNNPEASALGVDISAELIASAQKNALLLGLNNNFTALQADVADIRSTLEPESFDIVVSNPPYRRKNQGRLPASGLRHNALFEGAGNLASFIAAAAFALKNTCPFYCIYSAERMAELFAALIKNRLEPKELLPIQSTKSKDCSLILLKANKNARSGLKIKPPLVLYEQIKNPPTDSILQEKADNTKTMKLSAEALTFCPWLACNSI